MVRLSIGSDWRIARLNSWGSSLSKRHELFLADEGRDVMAWATAIAILVFLFLLHRRLAYFALALALAVGTMLWFTTEKEAGRRTAEKQAISARAGLDADACPDPVRPIMVEFTNGSDRAVERLSFNLTAKLKGHSTIGYRAFLRNDSIMEPGQSSVTCYATLPHGFSSPRPQTINLDDYEWSVDISLATFSDNNR